MSQSWYEKEVKTRRFKWIKALIEGDYLQGTGKLLHNDRYCCLGVACEVFSGDLNIKRWQTDEVGVTFGVSADDRSANILPEALRKYLGLSLTAQNVLINLNDSGVKFGHIADVISVMEISEEEEE
jgi:hypothetical protein